MSVVVPTEAVLALDVHLDHTDITGAMTLLSTSWPGPILVASTTPIGVPGEHAIRVGPLAPEDAVAFVAHRTEQLRGRPPAEAERTTMSTICERSGGMPLVLELCARQLASRLADDLLTVPDSPGLVARLATMVDQLADADRSLLDRLVWIDGGFDAVDATRLVERRRPSIAAEPHTASHRAGPDVTLGAFQPISSPIAAAGSPLVTRVSPTRTAS